MRSVIFTALLGLALCLHAAAAQPPAPAKTIAGLPVESVTVVGVKPTDETIKNFVDTRTAPTRVLGKMARWTKKICPETVGLGDKYAAYVSQRIRDIATAVGAPVYTDSVCRPNVEIVFTTTPQGLMDNVRKHEALFLGYYDDLHQADELAKFEHPIQAWYATETMDRDGNRIVDSGRCGMNGTTTLNTTTDAQTALGGPATAGTYQVSLPCAITVHSSGSRVNNGLSSGFYNALIVAEPDKVYDFEVGSLADYIAMLALSQPASLDSCQVLPSISNMLAKDCATVPMHITDGDLAYLRALYKMPDGTSLGIQRDEMGFEMKKTLVTNKGGAD